MWLLEGVFWYNDRYGKSFRLAVDTSKQSGTHEYVEYLINQICKMVALKQVGID